MEVFPCSLVRSQSCVTVYFCCLARNSRLLFYNFDSVFMDSSSSISSEPSKKGLSMFSAAIFVAAEMAGSGLLAVPKAVVDCGWIGLVLLFVFCANAAYSGTRLAKCWDIIEERYPEFRVSSRKPYPTIASKAVGHWGSVLVSCCIQFTLFGATIVYLLLASQIIQSLLSSYIPGFGYCLWFLFFAIIIIPPMWLGSPKDFGFAGIGALATTAISCVLVVAQAIMDGSKLDHLPVHKSHSVMEFFLSCGVILFAFGGASTFPTIQNDMIEKRKFSNSVLIGFGIIICLYGPMAFSGYFVYGDKIQTNILLSLSQGVFQQTANTLMAVHLLLAIFIIINPVCLEIEDMFNVPHEFCLKRCIVRTSIVLVMIVVGETIPRFGVILALIGGSTIALCTFVLPQLFYMRLCDQKNPEWPERSIRLWERIYLWELIVIGIIGGCLATYSAVTAIIDPHSFTTPCYWPKRE